MSNPYFSIIIPVFNAEPYLRRCLNSILKQAFTSFEILIINDGSTDNSEIIANEMAQNNSSIKVFNQKNSGVSAARNKGLDNANGKYVLFVDPDDYLDDETLIALSKCTNESPDVVCFNVELATQQRIYSQKLEGVFAVSGPTTKEFFIDGLFSKFGYRGYAWNKAYRLNAIQDIRFDEDVAYLEDELFNVKVGFSVQKIYFLPKTLYVYWQHEGSVVNGTSYRKITALLALRRIYDLVPQKLQNDIVFRLNLFAIELASQLGFRNESSFKELRQTYRKQKKFQRHFEPSRFDKMVVNIAKYSFRSATLIYKAKTYIVKSRFYYLLKSTV